ncbi:MULTISPECIES: hypothetical protein [Xanthomonas]|uniref:hypothetical protein n=1 Tax=Xanthomonas TaxID=338 RepID=UPI001AD976E5|nr:MULTISPECIES: hypothetical protein [unclassified Xanthomonas]MBO9875662.1 hypothetical protein [Xanthomonas sp. D-93]WNH43340.1 hypothetical protein PG878_12415 [Xanthomonas sp. A6251]
MQVDEIYYRVTYLDPEMRLPVIRAYICLGVNLSDEDVVGDTWYFQDVFSYYESGSALAATEPDIPVVCLAEEELTGDMLDAGRLHDVLEEIRTKRRRRDINS